MSHNDYIQFDAELKNWKIVDYYGNYVVIGEIYGDKKNRFVDGTVVTTSSIKSLDLEAGILKTKNSLYTLEKV